jgi:hypothetical protein
VRPSASPSSAKTLGLDPGLRVAEAHQSLGYGLDEAGRPADKRERSLAGRPGNVGEQRGVRNLACLSQDAAGSPSYASFISRNAASVLDADQDTTTTFGADPDLNLFGFLWDNNGNPWPGTETANLNEATQGSALDALVASMGDSYAMC